MEIRRVTRRCQNWSAASQCTRRTVGTMDHLRGCFLESEDILAQACSGHQGSLQKLWGGGAKFIMNSIGPMIGHSHSNHSVSLRTRNQVYHWNMVENQLHQTFKQNTNWTTAGNDWNMYTSPNTNSESTWKKMFGRAFPLHIGIRYLFMSFFCWDSARVTLGSESCHGDPMSGAAFSEEVRFLLDILTNFFAGRFVLTTILNVSCISWLIHISEKNDA